MHFYFIGSWSQNVARRMYNVIESRVRDQRNPKEGIRHLLSEVQSTDDFASTQKRLINKLLEDSQFEEALNDFCDGESADDGGGPAERKRKLLERLQAMFEEEDRQVDEDDASNGEFLHSFKFVSSLYIYN